MTAFEVRQARPEDARALAELFAAVAEERDRIATEPPVDVDKRTTQFAAAIDGTIVAVAGGDCVGSLHIFGNKFGVGEFGMAVARPWRGNDAAIALYRKFGFVEEGRRVRHYRRASGELWDSLVMGLLL